MKAPEIFNSQTLKPFTKEIMNRIGDIEGIGIQKTGGRFDDAEFTMKIKFKLENSNVKSTAHQQYDMSHESMGVPAWGFKFRGVDGTLYEMVNYKPRSPKYPIIGKNAKGTQYKFSIDQIKNNIVEETV